MSDDERTGESDAGRGEDRGSGDTARLPTLEKEPASDGGLEQSASTAAYVPGEGDQGGRARRFWSTRRVPATILALALLAGAGLLLYDVVAVRLDRTAMAWRRTLADELATRQLDDVWVRVGAVVAVLLGLWLLVLAVTPGLRRLLPMRGDPAHVRAGLERGAAALVLRDRAMEVSGVQSARVGVTRRKVKARAQAHFRELDEVRADVDAALEDGLRQLGLARTLKLSVHLRRPAKR